MMCKLSKVCYNSKEEIIEMEVILKEIMSSQI